MKTKQFTNNEGWTFDIHERSRDLFSIPSELVTECKTHAVRLVHIASSPGLTRRVYFVDRLDGKCLITVGQYPTKELALESYYSHRFAAHNGDVDELKDREDM